MIEELVLHVALQTAQCIVFKSTEQSATNLGFIAVDRDELCGRDLPFDVCSSAHLARFAPRMDL